MVKSNIKKIINEFCAFILQILFSKICFLKIICPFGLPFALVRVFYGGNIFCIIFSYMVSKLYTLFRFSDLFICFFEIIIITLFYFLINIKKLKKPLLALEIFGLLSLALKFYYALIYNENLILHLENLILTLIIIVYFYKFFKIYKNKFLFFKFSNTDYLYFSLFIFFITIGLYSFKINLIYFEYFFIVLAIIFCCKILPIDKFLVFGLSIGIGAALATKNMQLLLFSGLLSILLINFRQCKKFCFAGLTILSIGIYYLLTDSMRDISFIVAIIPVLIFVCFKSKFLNKIQHMFEIDSLNLICEDLRKNSIAQIKNKLLLMANTLGSMQKDLKFLLIGKISREKASIELAQDVINSCCSKCENFKTCFMQNINKRGMIEHLLSKAIEKGKIFKDDVVLGLQSYCVKENIIISEINQEVEMFLNFERAMKSEDASKLMISDNLSTFSDMFFSFANFLEINLKINNDISIKLKEKLTNAMLDIKDLAVIESNNGIKSINLIARNEHIVRHEMLEVINKFSKNNFKLEYAKHMELSGLSYASFIPNEKLKINFAVASQSKETYANGDNVAVTKVAQNRYFIAIADGMGHGDKANRISSMVLSLVRSMFLVGFDGNLIINSINKLLLPAALDEFSSLDACEIDLDSETCTFVKMGSSISVLKHANTSEIISCKSLPIGIVDNIKPTIIRKHISVGDTLFLASDGVVDSFNSIEDYKNYINDMQIVNLQKTTDEILFDANFQNKKHPDDMTIIAINILKNY